jgi:hypothetical protein
MNSKTAKKLRKEARKYQRDTFGQFDLAFKCLNSQRLHRRIALAWRLIRGKL